MEVEGSSSRKRTRFSLPPRNIVFDDDCDDDRPLPRRPRQRTVLRRRRARAEEDGDGERPRIVLRIPGSTPPAQAPPEPEPSSSSDSSSSVIRDATVENNGAIDCVICFLPLKPPIFQCNVGHVVCSRCSERQGEASNCHECRAPTPGGYTRCHAMEKVVESIRVPCPHAVHGCAHRPPYHGRDAHAVACPHAPCHCPGVGCVFAGSPAALAGHFAAAHGWPCATVDGVGSYVCLRDSFNFVTAANGAKNKERFLFLLDVKHAPPFGRAVAAFCIYPDRAATATLKLTHTGNNGMHVQSSEFTVACTDLADGLPDPSSSKCFQFVVPSTSVLEDDDGDSVTTRVFVEIITPPRPSNTTTRMDVAKKNTNGSISLFLSDPQFLFSPATLPPVANPSSPQRRLIDKHRDRTDGGAAFQAKEPSGRPSSSPSPPPSHWGQVRSEEILKVFEGKEVGGGSRRPRQEVGEAGESSSNRRKRTRYSPLMQALGDDSEPEPVSEAENDGSNCEEEDEEEEEEEEEEDEEEEQSECETDGYDSDDAVEDQQNEQQGGRGVQDQPPQQQEVMQAPLHLLQCLHRCHHRRGYQRCHAMEQMVDSIRVPCLHAAYGCTERPVYHSRESHAQACTHAPCHCRRLACGFVGSTAALLLHFAAVHRWPCTTEDKAGVGFDINLTDGFNFITAARAGANQGTTDKYLFLLNVARTPFGRTIAVFCIHPHHTSTAELRLTYGCYRNFDMCCMHHQTSEFKVACTDLSKGLPDPSKCFMFIVPGSACRDDEVVTKVTATINKTPVQ
ncbi:hypothetical protein HU200_007928 [Digitaria exilis]|uniref:RING-type E3 ubiquitin transferase n=1 Tax=Digitaria exilis TaxID=1010633 RepID=A0A835FPB9_9POAL|nr:hypothetical protein HU200_007928 [Digitaria exilis]